jgi:hypothetical protein
VKKIIILIVIILSFSINRLYSQFEIPVISTNLYFSPVITLGYTFGSGLNFGLDFTLGLVKIKHYNPEISGALSLQYYLVSYEKSMHIIKNVTLIAESEYFRIGIGAGEIKKSWGFRNRNVSKAFGTNVDFGISAFSYKVPWLGVKAFMPRPGTWEWCENKNYISAYTYFKQEPIFLFKQ